MDYRAYQLADFLKDEFFVSWVLSPNEDSDHFWQKWLTANPDRVALVEQAREMVSSVGYQQTASLTDIEYSAMLEVILRANDRKNDEPFPWFKRNFLKVAASLVLLISAVFAVIKWTEKDPITENQLLIISTVYGQKKNLVLPDGTKVTLNSGSQLTYPKEFGPASRKVALEGEAFFDVERDVTKPFSIESSGLTTTVLGTSFNIRNYSDVEDVKVAVITGRVKVSSPNGEQEILTPTEMGVFEKSSENISVTTFDTDDYIGWTEGLLIFDNETLPVIFDKLERWYGVDVQVKGQVDLEGRYSGKYKNKSLELIMEGISYTSHFKYSINQKNITIYEED